MASGMQGIQDKIEPPEIFKGDIYEAKNLPRVPHTLNESVGQFGASQFVRSAFGNEVVDHYCHFYAEEVKAYQATVTDWEHKRYFERI